ncbi:MAG: flagellar hook basal-body protein [Candidatus Eisenbacteria sp.]|nr:flagellar hook basal-body protein [Candidatus Eisenbacteria bacterium]
MVRGILISGAALEPATHAQSVLANNLANASAAGFRQDRIGFEQVAARSSSSSGVVGTPAPQLFAALDSRPGAYEVTDRPFDLAIQGEGFFVVDTPSGERFTRAGHFQRGEDGTLVTSQGFPLLGEGGALVMPDGAPCRVTPSGELRAGEQLVGRVRVVRFEDPAQLRHAGGGLLDSDGEPLPATESRVLQGVLEGPNVQALQVLVEMLTLTRHFEMNQKAFQAQDESLGRLLDWAQA